jgi:hypothetical protein
MVASQINETNSMGGYKSLYTNLTLLTTNTKVSPVIDTSRMSMIAVQNRLNQPTSGNTPNFIEDTAPTGSSSSGIYVTKPIVLENISTAIDLRITANVRTSSSVKVYYRVTSSSEVRNVNDLAWTPFNTDGSSDLSVTPAQDDSTFKEYKYSDNNITGFTAFQIKVVLKGTNSAYPPLVKDLRGIALAL